MIRIVCRRKSNNGSCQINPGAYFLDQKTSFDYEEIVEKSDSDIEKHDDIRLEKTETTPFLFVYQSGWQKRLFARYGNETTLLGSTHHTTRYTLPLFFLVVKTNIDYQIVVLFVTENKIEESIEEALSIIKTWNETINPKHGMTDYYVEEFKAMEKVFKGRR